MGRLPLRPAPKAGTTATMAIPTEDTMDMEDTMEAITDIPTDTGREMLRINNKADLLLRPRLILNTCSMDIITPPLTLILLQLLLLNPSPTMPTQEVPSMPSLSVKPRLRPAPNLGTTVTMAILTDTTVMEATTETTMEATTDIPTDTGGNK